MNLVDQDGNFLVTQDGDFFDVTSTYVGIPASIWDEKTDYTDYIESQVPRTIYTQVPEPLETNLSGMLPATVWRVSDGNYDITQTSSSFLSTPTDNLVDQDGNFLITGATLSSVTPRTIWDEISDLVNAIEDEMGSEILDEMGFPIEDEANDYTVYMSDDGR